MSASPRPDSIEAMTTSATLFAVLIGCENVRELVEPVTRPRDDGDPARHGPRGPW